MKLYHLALAALFVAGTAAAQSIIEAEGVAAIDAGGMDKARLLAVQDALNQAALSAAAEIETSSRSSATGALRESVRVTPAAEVSGHTVLREWAHDGLLHVMVRAEIRNEAPPSSNRPNSGGSKNAARSVPKYKKKVAVTRFNITSSLQVEDISDIWNGYPLELLRRLEARGGTLPVNVISSLLPDGREANPDSPANRDLIRSIAERTGSQFVISGVILDAGFGKETIRPYAGWQGNETGRRFELGLPWNSVVAGLKPEPSERRLEVEIFIHDGLTGALIARHRDSAEATGRVTVGRDKAFASAAFFATPFGQTVERTLNTQVEAIDNNLACLPFMANIVRIEGRKIFLDAGGTSALAPGDKLMVYSKNTMAPMTGLFASATLGIPESAAATVTLLQVQPLFAAGELAADPAKVRVQEGDVVRSDPAACK